MWVSRRRGQTAKGEEREETHWSDQRRRRRGMRGRPSSGGASSLCGTVQGKRECRRSWEDKRAARKRESHAHDDARKPASQMQRSGGRRRDSRQVCRRLSPVLQTAAEEVDGVPSRRATFARAGPHADALLGRVEDGRRDDEACGSLCASVDLQPEGERIEQSQ